METKKSVVRTAIYQKEWSGKHLFEITMDNGDKGTFFSTSNSAAPFVEGQEVEYTIEKKEKGNYTNYLINPARKNGFPGGIKVNPMHEHKRIALKCSVELVCSGKITVDDIPKYAASFMKFLSGE